jgi:hypothetical protein
MFTPAPCGEASRRGGAGALSGSPSTGDVQLQLIATLNRSILICFVADSDNFLFDLSAAGMEDTI